MMLVNLVKSMSEMEELASFSSSSAVSGDSSLGGIFIRASDVDPDHFGNLDPHQSDKLDREPDPDPHQFR
jgi:hypothetical protein